MYGCHCVCKSSHCKILVFPAGQEYKSFSFWNCQFKYTTYTIADVTHKILRHKSDGGKEH